MIEYEVNDEFGRAVEDMVANKSITEFNPLREHEIKLLTQLCIRTNKDGDHVEGPGAPIVCKKVPAAYRELIDGDYVIIADYYFWNHNDEIKQKAALHRALMQIEVEEKEKDNGEKKLMMKMRKPEIQEFRSTVARFGAYNDALLDFREAMKSSARTFVDAHKPRG